MRNVLFTLVLLFVGFSFSSAIAKNDEAEIRHGVNPMYGNIMKVLKSDRVSGSLRDLEVMGAGEDEDLVLACYTGKPENACRILVVAVREENDRHDLKGRKELKLEKCETNRYDNLLVDIRSKEGSMRIGTITKCR